MTVFWLVAALFVAGALLMMLPPLLQSRTPAVDVAELNAAVHRDHWRELEADLAAGLLSPDRAEQARDEIRRRVLEDAGTATTAVNVAPSHRMALAIGLILPLASVALYLALGTPQSVAPAAATAPRPAVDGQGRHRLDPAQIQQMATGLAERLQREPGYTEGWLMLARSYTALGRYRDAAGAFRRASELLPGDAGVIADLADVTGMAQGKRLAGEPARLIQQALDLDPKHVKALALAGSVAFETRDYAAARGYWERLLPLLPPDSPMQRSIRGSIAQANSLEGGATPAAGAAPSPMAATGPRLTGSVTLSNELAARLQPGDTLFVFARAAQGPRMPLAIIRRPASLPFEFSLDDTMAMAPTLKLSGFPQVVVGARISRSGNATPQTGDLVGQSAPVAPDTQDLIVTIDRIEP